ncbi:hypothetical protein [Spirosoma aerophilum]
MKIYKSSSLLLVVITGIFLVVSCQENHDLPGSQEAAKSGKRISALAGSKAFCGLDATARVAAKNAGARIAVLNTTIYTTDYVSAGVGGMRDVGSGSINLSGLSGTVTKAYLYWNGVTNASTDVGNAITVNGTPVTGTNIGVSSSNCWPYANSQAYRAEVTTLVQSTGNGAYNLAGFGDMNPNGASLIVFFNDGNNTNNRDVVIFEGNDSNIQFAGIEGNPNAPADPTGWDILLSGITYTAGSANIQLHVADGQPFPDDELRINGVGFVPSGPVFDGNSVPGGQLWDIKTFDVTPFLSPGPNSLNLTTGVVSDCLGLVVALIDLPAGAAPVTDITVAFDVHPTSCPNPLNMTQKGVVPMAILGTAGFDVTKIDVSTIKVNGVSPIRSSIEDVTAPYSGAVTDCSTCTTAGPDGIPDLTLKFSNESLTQSIGSAVNGSCISLTVTGTLLPAYGSTPVTGLDYVRIKSK